MTFDERDLASALERRSGHPTGEYRGRLSAIIATGRPEANRISPLAMVASVLIAAALIASLVLACHALPAPAPGAASSARVATPTPLQSPSPPVAGVLNRPAGPIAMPADVTLSAPTQDVVWALVIEQYLYRSRDRGRTWEQRPMPPYVGRPPEISFVDDREGWLIETGSPATQCEGEAASIWHTADAGTTWEHLGSNGISLAQCKRDLSFVDSLHGFLSAWDDNHAPVIYRTADGGLTWSASSPLPDPPGWTTQGAGVTLQAGPVRDIGALLLVPAFGYQSGASVQYVFQSHDGGATWTYVGSATKGAGAFAIVTPSRWIELLVSPDSLETTDSGATWHRFASDYSQAAGVAPVVIFAGPDVGYATVRGGIQLTTDGGLHWTYLTTPGTT